MQTLDLGAAAAEVARVVSGVRDDQLSAPTPCPDMPVAALLDHLMGLTLAFRLSAEKRPLPGAPKAAAADLAPDWRDVLPRQLDELVAAWREPSAWKGLASAGGVEMPAPQMGVVALDELLVHGWDLAVATGQEYRPSPEAVAACAGFVESFAAAPPEAREGMYGPVVSVLDDSPPFDRLLGLTGRSPAWRP